ncbi:hypothetical protein GDO78_001658 [Eleutherodactylus coqui]|uniref:Uncharacterized protein n=1 Tax=Eleutherodactylus coqui TaxID=57060 RepID=A0A8J6FW45_ELECQ|nr:hypothetical protein GDO78_001658 [Eleutherodactylus coqui]
MIGSSLHAHSHRRTAVNLAGGLGGYSWPADCEYLELLQVVLFNVLLLIKCKFLPNYCTHTADISRISVPDAVLRKGCTKLVTVSL